MAGFATPAEAVVELESVSLRFGPVTVVRDVSVRIATGTICALLAPSGGGKTSVLRLITGIYPPSSGMVRVLGGEPHRFTDEERRQLGYMPQHFVLYPELSVRRNLEFMAGIYGLSRRSVTGRIDTLLAMTDLASARDRRAGKLSGGMQRRLQLAATLLHDPALLVIDEPTAGIDPLLRARFWDHFRALREQGRTLIVATQYVTEAAYCDQVVLLRDGQLVASGSPADLWRQAFGTPTADASRTSLSFEDVFLRLMAAEARGSGG